MATLTLYKVIWTYVNFVGLITPIVWSHLNIRNLWRLWAEPCWLAGDGEEGGHAQGHPPGHVLHIHPEGDPGHYHKEDGGDVGLHQVEPNASVKVELRCKAAVVS